MTRDREVDRQRFTDPDFNKWLDDGISDAGHTVWDAVPDIGSAWNGWDASKAALDYYCPSCSGSGEEIHTTYHGPDSFERVGRCSACNGDGRTSAALAVALGRLEASESMQGLYTSTVIVERAELEQTKRERDQLKAEVDSLTREADRQYTTIESYRSDAERLRWLRRHEFDIGSYHGVHEHNHQAWFEQIDDESIDRAIEEEAQFAAENEDKP